jgi:hypothetical protein
MATDLHDQHDGRTSHEFIGAKGSASGMGCDPGPPRALDFDVFVSLPIGEFDGVLQSRQFGDQFDLLVELVRQVDCGDDLSPHPVLDKNAEMVDGLADGVDAEAVLRRLFSWKFVFEREEVDQAFVELEIEAGEGDRFLPAFFEGLQVELHAFEDLEGCRLCLFCFIYCRCLSQCPGGMASSVLRKTRCTPSWKYWR